MEQTGGKWNVDRNNPWKVSALLQRKQKFEVVKDRMKYLEE